MEGQSARKVQDAKAATSLEPVRLIRSRGKAAGVAKRNKQYGQANIGLWRMPVEL